MTKNTMTKGDADRRRRDAGRRRYLPVDAAPVKAAVLSVSMLLMSFASINGALPAMRDDLGVSTQYSELMSTVPSVVVVVFIFLAGGMSRRFGCKRVITAGMLILGAAGIVPVFAASFPLIFASRLLFGVGMGLFNGLVVDQIGILYHGDARASMLGLRASAEQVGQALFTLLAGVLLAWGWHISFAIYALAFPVAAVFWLIVPDDLSMRGGAGAAGGEAGEASSRVAGKARLDPIVYLFMLFSIATLVNYSSVGVRFPSIAVGLNGEGYNPSFLLSLMPVCGIAAGIAFGWLNRRLGKGVFLLGIVVWLVVDLLLTFGAASFPAVVVAMLLNSVPLPLCLPYLLNTLAETVDPRVGVLATSLMFASMNLGNFLGPVVMNLIASVSRSDSLTIPFPVYAVVFAAILVAIMVHDARVRP
ncbi:MFS transporter [Bifidobacterium platyrrhinorum]|nr:MFS transporter [Bifidobacterium platyrrhinorum]